MALSRIWDQLKRNLLTFGYVRSTFKQTPEDIIHVILSFYDDMKYWTITKGKQMSKFFNSKCKEIMHGPHFSMKNIEFQCIVAPNGYSEDHIGKVALILRVSKVPTNVKYVYVYFILFCNETKYEHKVTRILTENTNKNDSGNVNKCSWRSQFPWATNAVNLEDLIGFESITFGYYVDIIHIAYEPRDKSIDLLDFEKRKLLTYGFIKYPVISYKKIMDLILEYQGKSYWTKGVKMSSKCEYEWVVTGNRLKQMKNCHYGQHFYSSNFDGNNWCLYISPCGWTKDNQNLFSFQLKLLQRPYKLAAIFVAFKLETKFKNIIIKKSQMFHYRTCRSGWSFQQNKILFHEFKELDKIIIKLKLEIVDGYDVNTRQRIKKTQWNEYGIVQNKD